MTHTRRVIGGVAIGALLVAIAFALIWGVTGDGEWEGLTTMAALVAALAGIPAERWAAKRELRSRALAALWDEVRRNEEILANDRFRPLRGPAVRRRVFPRLSLSAVDSVVGSGVLDSLADGELLNRLNQWRDTARELNHRLDLTEVYLFSADVIDPVELQRFDDALHSPDGYFTDALQHLEELRESVDAEARRQSRRLFQTLTEPDAPPEER